MVVTMTGSSTSNPSNRGIEEAAIAFVLQREEARGRPSRDTRGTDAAGDVAVAMGSRW
jgi:hypothetical protein